jgi:hypothetical protein
MEDNKLNTDHGEDITFNLIAKYRDEAEKLRKDKKTLTSIIHNLYECLIPRLSDDELQRIIDMCSKVIEEKSKEKGK